VDEQTIGVFMDRPDDVAIGMHNGIEALGTNVDGQGSSNHGAASIW
jgi:hypothetical protein